MNHMQAIWNNSLSAALVLSEYCHVWLLKPEELVGGGRASLLQTVVPTVFP